MRLTNAVLAATLAIAPFGIAISAKADTVDARCDVYPKGSDTAKSSGPCTFSQRQGAVSIQLQSGKRYELLPVGDQPGNYRDQNGKAAYRQSGLGDRGQIYRLATESIFVYWDPTPYNPSNNPNTPTNQGYRTATLTAADAGARINVRSQPTIKSSSPHYGLPGDSVQVLKCVSDRDTVGSDLNWCNVRFVKSKATGWVRSDYIIFSDGGE